MTTFKQQDQEAYSRMEFLAYSILAFALLGVTSVFYFIYHWFLA